MIVKYVFEGPGYAKDDGVTMKSKYRSAISEENLVLSLWSEDPR